MGTIKKIQTIKVKQIGTRRFEAWIRFGESTPWELVGIFHSYKEAERQARLALYGSCRAIGKAPKVRAVAVGRVY